MEERNFRKEKIGVVKSNKMQNSIVVNVERKVKHPKYGKFVKKSSNSWQMTRKTNAASEIPCAYQKPAP